MTDATMLEKAAKALAAEDARDRGVDLYNKNPGLYLRLARAVLMAVRNPNNSVLLAGEATGDQYEGCDPADCWPAMIDAILADGEGR
ncbi:hypothetical protein [Brevundimonas bullata]